MLQRLTFSASSTGLQEYRKTESIVSDWIGGSGSQRAGRGSAAATAAATGGGDAIGAAPISYGVAAGMSICERPPASAHQVRATTLDRFRAFGHWWPLQCTSERGGCSLFALAAKGPSASGSLRAGVSSVGCNARRRMVPSTRVASGQRHGVHALAHRAFARPSL